MSNNSNTTRTGGISFLGTLTILFIGLKLTNHITWGWGWVLSPLWIPFALFVLFVGLVIVAKASTPG